MRLDILITVILIAMLLLILKRIRHKRLVVYHSKLLGKIEVVQNYNREKVLTINTFPQGVSIHHHSIRHSYWYMVAKEVINHTKSLKSPKTLMFGLGANTISSLINKLNPKIHQTIVELDPLIIKVCEEHFGLKEMKNITIINDDAYKLIENYKLKIKNYDVVVVDIFTGNPPFIDIKSNQPKFIDSVLRYLNKGGAVIFNRPAHTKEVRIDNEKFRLYLKTLFKKVEVFDIQDPRGFRNHVITGSKIKSV